MTTTQEDKWRQSHAKEVNDSYQLVGHFINQFNLNKKIYENCKVLIFSFHTYNLEKNLSKIDYKNLEFEVNYAPNVVNEETSKAGAIVLVE